ncbi:MAG: STAS-like domain-containing protein [Rhodobacteraceae bacterium]|nr:STAS-like domain-containing protein [Paracoccaceae bacterium]MCF8512976.1 STAS-like domain-containing protein [Paracoccaceae bacterium]MCF8517221.1 STAS-like domain-containing protein [Paracoccaceae bacterium]
MGLMVGNLISGCDTNVQGELVIEAITSALRAETQVTVDFTGINCVTSSFVNSAFVPLLSRIGYAAIKSRIQIRGANKQIVRTIRDRLDSESSRLIAA